MNVPAEILSKPGRLSGLEFDIIKVHPSAGYEILKVIDFPWPVAEVAHQHQERMDGSGYPQGLKEDQILLETRIVSVADVIEAMTFPRPYRPVIGLQKALTEIGNGRELLYYAPAVDACLKLFREGKFHFDAK
jgi:HD-GYP domain-containing protein (c-di-GMP phosphodiesterase class II)